MQNSSFLDHLAHIDLFERTLERPDGLEALALAAKKVLRGRVFDSLLLEACTPQEEGPSPAGDTHTLLVEESATFMPPWDPDAFNILVDNTAFRLGQVLDHKFAEILTKQATTKVQVEDIPRETVRLFASRDNWGKLPGEPYLGGATQHTLGWIHDLPVFRADVPDVLALIGRPVLPALPFPLEASVVRVEGGLRLELRVKVKVTFTTPVYIAGVATQYEPGSCAECNGSLLRESSTKVRCTQCRCIVEEPRIHLHAGTTDKPKSFFGKLFGG